MTKLNPQDNFVAAFLKSMEATGSKIPSAAIAGLEDFSIASLNSNPTEGARSIVSSANDMKTKAMSIYRSMSPGHNKDVNKSEMLGLEEDQALSKLMSSPGFDTRLAASARLFGLGNEFAKNIATIKLNKEYAEDATMLGSVSKAGLEEFAGQELSIQTGFTIATGLFGNHQDPFGSAFFPPIEIDPSVSGMYIRVETSSFYKVETRKKEGTPVENTRNPLIKNLFNYELLSDNQLKMVPVYRAGVNDAFLNSDYKYTVTRNGESITTAPLRYGAEGDLITLSASEAELKDAAPTNQEQMERNAKVTRLFYSLTGTVSGSSVTELFAMDVSTLPNLQYVNAGGNNLGQKGQLTINNQKVRTIIDLNQSLFNGGNSTIIQAQPALLNHKVEVSFKLSGDINVFTANGQLTKPEFTVIAIRDNNGIALLPTDGTYIKIIELLGTVVHGGYEIEAYRLDAGQKISGKLLTTDTINYFLGAANKQVIEIQGPANPVPYGDGQTDLNKVTSVNIALGAQMAQNAVTTLINHFNAMDQFVSNATTLSALSTQDMCVHYVNPTKISETHDLSTVVDSLTSTNRKQDIRAALINILTSTVLKMAIDSNYMLAIQALAGFGATPKIEVLIGTDPYIKNYLVDEGIDTIDLGGNFVARVVATLDPRLKGTMYAVFSRETVDRSTTPDLLSYGVCLKSMPITYDVLKTGAVNQASIKSLKTQPRYDHYAILHVGAEFGITGIEAVTSGKVGIKTI